MTRDLTKQQFISALRRNGFRPVLGWMEDTTTGNSYGMIRNGYGINRRASLAHALKRRDEVARETQKEAAE